MLSCIITSHSGTETYNKIKSVTLPAYSGQMQILPNHAEIFTSLEKGEIVIENLKSGNKTVPIKNGEAHIKNDTVNVIL